MPFSLRSISSQTHCSLRILVTLDGCIRWSTTQSISLGRQSFLNMSVVLFNKATVEFNVLNEHGKASFLAAIAPHRGDGLLATTACVFIWIVVRSDWSKASSLRNVTLRQNLGKWLKALNYYSRLVCHWMKGIPNFVHTDTRMAYLAAKWGTIKAT